jgi:predicted dehydrogenase
MYHSTFWAEAVQESPRGVLVGLWDDDPERGRRMAERFRARFYADLPDLLRECDAIGITSETAKHPDLVEAAAAAGVHVLCEKPLAVDLAGCDRIAAAVRRSGIVFMQSFPKRLDPINHRLREVVTSGSLGRIRLARVRHCHYYGLQGGLSAWHHDPAQAGGGALLDEGVHAADFLAWFFGAPEAVTASIAFARPGDPVEDTGIAVFSFPGGLLGEVTASATVLAAENSIEIYGTRGAAILSGVDLASRDLTQGGFLKVYAADPPVPPEERRFTVIDEVPRFKLGRFHHQNPLHFMDCLIEGRAPAVTLEDGRRALVMILAAYEAARTGRACRLADVAGGASEDDRA